jgi:hypothetical protein
VAIAGSHCEFDNYLKGIQKGVFFRLEKSRWIKSSPIFGNVPELKEAIAANI